MDIPDLMLSHFEDPYHRGEAERATHVAQAVDEASQHFVVMQLQVDELGTVEEAWFDARGCSVCEAPASILAQYCETKSIAELSQLSEDEYIEMTQLGAIAHRPSCSTLAWQALQAALNATEMDSDQDYLTFGGPSLGEES